MIEYKWIALMGWTSAFRDRIAQSNMGGPIFYLYALNAPFLPTSGASIASATAPGLYPSRVGLKAGISLPAESVETYTWNTTHGTWSVDVVGTGPSFLNGFFKRGTLVWLFMGFPDIQPSDYSAIAFGLIEQISTVDPNTYRISVGGLGMVLGSRLDKTAEQGSLFFNLPASTTLTADFDPLSDTTLTVGSITGAERETGGNYLVQVVTSATDGSGNTYAPFYLLASSASGSTITLVSASGALGTTERDANTGDTVNYLAYVAGDHPVDIALKVLTSTGSGNNGTYDTLPQSWGIGFPEAAIDLADVARTRLAVDNSVWATAAVLVESEAQSDPGTWLSSWLADMGIWITIRQGELTLRAAEDPASATQQTGIDVGDWIAQEGLQDHQWFDPNYPGEYTKLLFVDEGLSVSRGSQETPASTLPALDQLIYTAPVYSNILNCLIELDTRMSKWALRIPEVVTIDTAGWYCSQLSPGEFVYLTTQRFQSAEGGLNKREALVTGVSPNLTTDNFSTRLNLSLLPTTAN